MAAGTVQIVAQIGDLSFDATLSRDYEGSRTDQGTLPAGNAGSLTTRTDANTGVATLSEGHGIETADKVDVFWSGGSRYGMDATVDGNAVTIDGGGGDDLPDEDTALVVTKRAPIDVYFVGNTLKLLIACCKQRRVRLTFEDSGGAALFSRDLPAGEPFYWASDQGVTNPLAGETVASVQASNGESSGEGTIQVGAKIDSM